MKNFAMLFRASVAAALMALMFGAVAADKCSLCGAAGNGDLAEIKSLLAVGLDVNAADKDGWTALMAAAGNGHSEVAKVLLDAGANPNAADKDGLDGFDGGGTRGSYRSCQGASFR